MCKNYIESVKEVKCYLHDDDGNRYDLSPLAKKRGGYHVTAGPDTDLYINVCKDIVPGKCTCTVQGPSWPSILGRSDISLQEI